MSTGERYTTHRKVNELLRYPSAFTSSTTPTIEQVENLIEGKMDLIDNEIKTSFRLSKARERHNIDDYYQFRTGVRIYLGNRNVVIPLSGAAGDSLKVFDGSKDDEYVDNRSEDRANGDFWLDDTAGILHLKNFFFTSRYLGIDVTYRFNSGARGTLSGAAVSGTLADFNVDSNSSFPLQGSFTISGEQVRYSGLSGSTAFSIQERGAFGTQTDAQQDGTVLFWVPRDIEEACTKLTAIDLLVSEDWSSGGSTSGDLPSGQLGLSGKIEQWKKDVEAIFNRYRPALVGLR